jgi:hypothetical protein
MASSLIIPKSCINKMARPPQLQIMAVWPMFLIVCPLQNLQAAFMNLLKTLLESIPADPIPVRKLIIGVHWTLLSSKYCGLGSNLTGAGPHGQSQVRDVGLLHQKSAQDLAQWVLSDNLLEASIGMAALNSLLEVDENQLVQVNAAEIISSESKGKNLAIVGHLWYWDHPHRSQRCCFNPVSRSFQGHESSMKMRL